MRGIVNEKDISDEGLKVMSLSILFVFINISCIKKIFGGGKFMNISFSSNMCEFVSCFNLILLYTLVGFMKR